MFRKIVFLLCFSFLFVGGSAEELLTIAELHVRATGFAGMESATYQGCLMSDQRVGDLATQLLSKDSSNTLSLSSFWPSF